MWRPTNVDRPTGIFLALIVISLTLVTIDLRAEGEGIGTTLRDGAQAVFTPVERVVSNATRPVADFLESVSDLFSLREENRTLREQVTALEQQLQETESIRVRVRELEALLGVDPPEDVDAITARVLAVGVSEFDHLRVIDKGSADGIGVGMPVVDEGGTVGRVVAVTPDASRVKLITDPTVVIAVRVDRTGETGVLYGRGSGPMVLEMFNTNAAVVEDDLLVTADGRFPAGIPVARVLAAARSEVGFALRTTAEPTAEMTRVDYVRVLVFTRDEAGVTGLDESPDLPVPVPEDVGPAEGESEEAPTTTTSLPGSTP